jgi:LuxR family maltose regulon positive regulatory protein
MEQLLATKLFIPPTRPNIVPRPRLIDQLNACAYPGCKLILISAPAGFGKTTLVSEWVQATGRAVPPIAIAWLSLDEDDNDPTRFLAYFIAALNQAQGVEASIGKGSLNMLQSPQPPPTEAALTPLINEIAAIPDRIILVLDDYHVIESTQVDDILTFLLEYLPPQMHLVIASREDPHLPLSRLRARGQLTELRAADLRFTSSEAAEFLNQTMGLSLSAEDIAALESRTEGWIAGLQLAAISMRGHEAATSLIKTFTGSHRLVLDFLMEEVLSQQSKSIQNFLFQTAILDRMTGSLCDAVRFGAIELPSSSEGTAVTGQDSGQVILEMLEHNNLFIVPLDEERRWYRYHHLFADLLRQRLRQTQPEQLSVLHRRASEWYEQNGFADEAVEHTLRAEDFERAVYLIEQHVDTIWAHGEYTKLRRWLVALPDELVLSRPQLCIFQAWELFASGQMDAAERFLQAAELEHDPSTGQASETESQSQDRPSGSSELRVRGRAAAIQAWMAAYRRHNISGLIQHLRQALEYLPDQDLHWRGAVAITLADAHAFRGDMRAAYQARLEALKACEAVGNTYLFMYNSAKLALNLKAQGRLLQVQELCRQRVRFANESGMSRIAVVGWLLAIWGEVLAEINDLDGALDLVEKSIELTEHGGDVVMLGWSYLCLTRVLFSKRDMAGAEEIVQKMNNVARESIVPTWIMNLNGAWQSRIWLAQDKLEAAAQWVRERGLEPDKATTHMSGFEYVAFARILITQGRWDETIKLLQRMLEAAELGGDTTRVIEIMMLQALAFQAGGDTTRAMDALEGALTLAEPEGFLRIFVDEGQPMARLLYVALERGTAPGYVGRLLQAFPIDKPEQVDSSAPQVSESGYIEPLSEREIEVLQLIAEGLTNPEIATRLILSLYTVKTHTRNIYGKLGVHNRTEAVAKARVLGILQFT